MGLLYHRSRIIPHRVQSVNALPQDMVSLEMLQGLIMRVHDSPPAALIPLVYQCFDLIPVLKCDISKVQYIAFAS